MRKINIFDTTLRDGEQAPGASLAVKEKIEVAAQLEKLNVDIIEAGFPISSKADFDAVKAIAAQLKRPVVCGLARAKKDDIDAAYRAVKPAKKPMIHVFLATSKVHMKYKLKKAKDEILKLAVDSVKYARKKVDMVEFSPEDATRTDLDFLAQIVEAVIEAGAKVVNIPDTVGYTTPQEYSRIISYLKENVRGIDDVIISCHCHDDLGMATANSLSAVAAGAQQVECTINGIGERAGSTPLEEVVMALKTRSDLYQATCSVKTKELYKTSRLVSTLMGIKIQPNKAIVGANAFRHESGIHQDGILKERTTYEIMKPQDVGYAASQLVLGRHSGRHAFNERLKKLGFSLKKTDLEAAFERFKALAAKKKEIYDEDLEAIVEGQLSRIPEVWKLEAIHVITATDEPPLARAKLKSKNKKYESESSGDGPVDACYKAIDKSTRIKGQLMDYSIQSISKGKDALGEVKIKVKFASEEIIGRSASTDILEASARAYLKAINKYLYIISKKRK